MCGLTATARASGSESVVPNVNKLELNIGEPALDITPGEAAELFAIVTGT